MSSQRYGDVPPSNANRNANIYLRSFAFEVLQVIANNADIPSLLALRNTSRECYAVCDQALASARDAILAPYMGRDCDSLWSLLDEYHAVVGGMGALSFFLRDNSLLPQCLDIYVTDRDVRPLEWIRSDFAEIELELVAVVNTADNLPQYVYRGCVFQTTTGLYIRLCWSVSDSALFPIAGSPTTALMNFVGSTTFGCAYPALTLERRGFRRGLSALNNFEELLVNAVANTASFELRNRPHATAGSPSYRCARTSFTCPDQSRFFGDFGSLVHSFKPHYDSPRALRKEYRAPYGIAAVWRFTASETNCDGTCATEDLFLPRDVMAVTTMIIGDGVQLNNTYPVAPDFHTTD